MHGVKAAAFRLLNVQATLSAKHANLHEMVQFEKIHRLATCKHDPDDTHTHTHTQSGCLFTSKLLQFQPKRTGNVTSRPGPQLYNSVLTCVARMSTSSTRRWLKIWEHHGCVIALKSEAGSNHDGSRQLWGTEAGGDAAKMA
eukprot:1739771-Amphidinium_carterae.1